jgi:hypothetical protein
VFHLTHILDNINIWYLFSYGIVLLLFEIFVPGTPAHFTVDSSKTGPATVDVDILDSDGVGGCHGNMVSLCHGVMVSWCHGVMVSWCHGVMVSWCHGVMVSWCHGVMVLGCQGVRVSGCQGVMLSGCHDVTSLIFYTLLVLRIQIQ